MFQYEVEIYDACIKHKGMYYKPLHAYSIITGYQKPLATLLIQTP